MKIDSSCIVCAICSDVFVVGILTSVVKWHVGTARLLGTVHNKHFLIDDLKQTTDLKEATDLVYYVAEFLMSVSYLERVCK